MNTSPLWLTALAAGALVCAAEPAAAQSNSPAAAAPAASAPAAVDVTAPKYGAWGYDESGRDLSAGPGADFFRYANGAWYDQQVIPADRTRFGNFDKLVVLSESRTRLIIEQAAAGQLTDPDAMRVGDAYKAFMDEARVERLGAQPLAPDLDVIRGERTHARTSPRSWAGSASRAPSSTCPSTRTPRTPIATRSISTSAASACPIATIT